MFIYNPNDYINTYSCIELHIYLSTHYSLEQEMWKINHKRQILIIDSSLVPVDARPRNMHEPQRYIETQSRKQLR